MKEYLYRSFADIYIVLSIYILGSSVGVVTGLRAVFPLSGSWMSSKGEQVFLFSETSGQNLRRGPLNLKLNL